MNENQKPKYQKNPNEVGCIFLKKSVQSEKEYLALKLELDGQEYYLKAFLNSGYDAKESPNRPKYLVFKSNIQPEKNYTPRLEKRFKDVEKFE
jgi:hypothetical protein